MNKTLTVPLELKAITGRKLEGHGAIFGNVDHGGDIVIPGAFKKSLAEHKRNGTMPQMFWMHDPTQVPGMWESMAEDEEGLAVSGILADTTLGNDMKTLAGMKAVRGLSIGYAATDVDYDRHGNRLLKQVHLGEVSLVSMAMNPLAQIESVKARLSASGEYVPTEREFERFLREEGGYSKNVSRMLVAKLFDSDPGGMPDGRRWDAGSDEVLAAKAMERVLDKVRAASIRA